MPAWLIDVLVGFAVHFGLPWVLKKFPNLPPAVIAIIQKLIDAFALAHTDKKAAIAQAKHELKHCLGPTCPVEEGKPK